MKNKKKIGIAALVATLSVAFICSSLTPTFAAANTDDNNVSIPSTPYLKFLCKFSRIFFRVYKFRNGGVAGYVEYSGLVQSGK